jgi:hypothetical protein
LSVALKILLGGMIGTKSSYIGSSGCDCSTWCLFAPRRALAGLRASAQPVRKTMGVVPIFVRVLHRAANSSVGRDADGKGVPRAFNDENMGAILVPAFPEMHLVTHAWIMLHVRDAL